MTKLINLAKFLKGSTSIKELEDMPNSYLHTIYKEYVEMLKSEEKQQAHASEQVMDELQDQMT